MSGIGEGRHFLNRREAAAYITQRWFVISASSLARYAASKDGPKGPAFHKRSDGGKQQALYTREDLDHWAQNHAVTGMNGHAAARVVGALSAARG